MHGDPASGKEGLTSFFTHAASTFGQGDQGIRRFPHFGERLVAVADLPIGGRVLDIATGRGAVLFPAVERVGRTGTGLGIDITPSMVEATAEDIAQRGLTNAEVRVMDGEQLELSASSFDAVLCGFGLMFFPHLAEALAGFRRVLKPGGILAVSTWAGPDANYAWEPDLWRAYGIWDRHATQQMVQRLAESDELAAVLSEAGFTDIRVLHEVDERRHADPNEWWARTFELGPARASVESLGAERAAQFKQDAFTRLAPLAGPNGLRQRIEACFGLARNP
jgi:ubiquinone/menaquinone biosynthesis C-methylase UbiE